MRVLLSFMLAALLVVGCSSENQEQAANGGNGGGSEDTESYFAADTTIALSDSAVVVAGLEIYAPELWTDLGPSGMRKAEWAYGPVEGEEDSATVTVYYFGPESGGAVRANIDRWIGQMAQPDGSDPADAAVEKQITIEGMPAHIVEVTGTYTAGGMGMGQNITKPDYRMTGVVLEGPQGNVFFKLTGPEATAAEMTEAFATMIRNVEPAETASM